MKLNIAKDELDFAQKSTLNEDFWQNEKLNPEVRKVILAIVKNYLKSTNLRLSIDNIDEIEFTGSLANYNHNKFSDVDIHLLFDFSELGNDPDFMRELLTAKAINWNNRHNITIFGHEVELYVVDAGSDHHSTGVYSVKNDQWLVKPVKDAKLSAELNLNKVKDKADKISKQIDMLAVKDDVSLEKIESLKDKIKKMRESGLETGGEYSTENLAFKLLRRRGELNTLYALMQQAQDAELSLDEGTEWWKKRRKLDNKNYRELMGYIRGAKVSKKGKPYMVSPQMKLPKSGPPGVGSLEEQSDLNEATIPLQFQRAFKKIQSATMKFQVLKVVKGSLGIFKGTAFKPGKDYDGIITGNKITFKNTEAITGAKQIRTKDEFLKDLKDTPGEICQIIKCDTSTITTGGKTQTFEKFIATLAGPQKPSQPVVQQKKQIQQKKAASKLYDQPGKYGLLGSGPVRKQTIDRIIHNLFKYRTSGDTIRIFFRDVDDLTDPANPNKCLKPHSFTIKLIDDEENEYSVSLDQKSYRNIVHPENEVYGTNEFYISPTLCTPNEKENFNLQLFRLINFIAGNLASGVVSRIDYESPGRQYVSYFGREEQERLDRERIKMKPIQPVIPLPAQKSKFRIQIEQDPSPMITIVPFYKDESVFINYSNAFSKLKKSGQEVYKDLEKEKYLDAAAKAAAGVYNSLNNNIIIPASGKEGKIALNKGENRAVVKTKTVTTKALDQLKGPVKRIIITSIDVLFDKIVGSFKPSGPKPPVTSPVERARWELQEKFYDEVMKKKPSVIKTTGKEIDKLSSKSSELQLPLEQMLGLLDAQSNYNISTLLDLKKTKVLTLDKNRKVAKFTLEDYLKITDFASVKGRKSKKRPKPSGATVNLGMLKVVAKRRGVNIKDLEPELKESLNNLAAYIAEKVGDSNVKIVVWSGKDTAGGHKTGGHPKGLAVDFNVKVGNQELDQKQLYAYTLKAIADGKINGGKARIGYYGGEYDPQEMTPTNRSGIHMDLDFDKNKGAWFWFKCEDMVVCKDETCNDKLNEIISSRDYLRKYKKQGYKYVESCKGKNLNGGPKVLSLAKGGKKLKTISYASKKDVIEKNLLALPDDVLNYLQ